MPDSQLIDAHCHIDFVEFDEDRDQVLHRAQAAGISDIIIPGVSILNWRKIQSLCEQHENLHPCYGLHPYWVRQHEKNDLEKLKEQIKTRHCVGLGECGLDYRPEQADKKTQQYFFQAQLDIAMENQLPVIIHSVRATEDVIQQIRKRPELRGMIHSYSGSVEQALQLIEAGIYLSFSSAICYSNAKKLRHCASKLPLSALLIETDAPDQPGEPHKGERNEPSYLIETLSTLSELRSEPKETIAKQTAINTKHLFNIA